MRPDPDRRARRRADGERGVPQPAPAAPHAARPRSARPQDAASGQRPPRTMGMLYSFINGGSERLGALIAADLAAAYWPVEVCATHSDDGPVRDWLRERGVPAYGLDVDRAGRIRRRWRLYRLLRSRRIEVLHVQHFSLLALCYWPARLAGVRRIVVTEHNEMLLRASGRLRRRSRFFGARADQVTVIHAGVRRYLIDELGLPSERVRTIDNGVDIARFAPAAPDPALRAELGAGPGELLIGSVGRLHPLKDQRSLLHALAQLRRTEPAAADVRLALIGDGEEREALERLSEQLGVAEVVCFAGDRGDVDRLVPQLDAFVLPSRTEGVPLVLLEAMACGVPSIATAVGGIPDVLRDGGGRVVRPESPQALAAELAALVRDPAARRRMGERGREIIAERHDLANTLASYRRLLFDLCRGGGTAPAHGETRV